ncbi:hypothetical protein [Candidatus Methanocrinis natronophilus]|uniref:Uncharacterized protein n=1 Tax=Candidatus Methanocrinis natronophilus TaxID=3033396 RepID=A0ABT5X676_9EURY|nr:hypothetical protein [Candidatus Methanocrinis natronophilus]MDF0590196.1 hypothetical protein [Candidatus Methanocrinis natronophilus]
MDQVRGKAPSHDVGLNVVGDSDGSLFDELHPQEDGIAVELGVDYGVGEEELEDLR